MEVPIEFRTCKNKNECYRSIIYEAFANIGGRTCHGRRDCNDCNCYEPISEEEYKNLMKKPDFTNHTGDGPEWN